MTEFVFKEKTYVLTEGEGENGCPCNICAFNTMGAEGAQACHEAPPCDGDQHYILKEETDKPLLELEEGKEIQPVIDWDEEMREFRNGKRDETN